MSISKTVALISVLLKRLTRRIELLGTETGVDLFQH